MVSSEAFLIGVGERVRATEAEYVWMAQAGEGLYPAPFSRHLKSANVSKIRSKFKFLGKFLARALMDSRMVSESLDLPAYSKGERERLGGCAIEREFLSMAAR